MPRPILEDERIDPAIRARIAELHADIVHNVQAAAGSNAVLVVGMGWNPFVRRARRILTSAGIAHHALVFGNYLTGWRRRNALKMWSGWPTFPMVFVKGRLVGGAAELARLVESGELKRMLGT
jgi:glutaredoxin-related protein